MLKPKYIINIILISFIISSPIISFKEREIPNLKISKEEAKIKIFNFLREEAKKFVSKYPEGIEKLITNLGSTTSIILDEKPIKEIESLRNSHNLPNEIIEKFKKIKYVKDTISYELFIFKNQKSKTNIENIFGVVTRLNENNIYFAYVRGNSNAKIIPQFNKVPYKKCHHFGIGKKCKTKHKNVRRGFNEVELENIKNALISKFYENLNSVLDLDKQRIIDIFKKFAKTLVKPFPTNYKKYVVNQKTFLNFKTIYLGLNGYEETLIKIGFNEKSINKIKLLNEKGKNIEIFQTLKDESQKQDFIVSVGLNIGNNILLSYAIGKGEVKLYNSYCHYTYVKTKRHGNKRKKKHETVHVNEDCDDDDECVESCNNFKKNNPTILDPSKAGSIIKDSVYAELTQGIYEILNGIQF